MFTVVQVDTDHVVVGNANPFFGAINLTDQIVHSGGINLGIVLSREAQVGRTIRLGSFNRLISIFMEAA